MEKKQAKQNAGSRVAKATRRSAIKKSTLHERALLNAANKKAGLPHYERGLGKEFSDGLLTMIQSAGIPVSEESALALAKQNKLVPPGENRNETVRALKELAEPTLREDGTVLREPRLYQFNLGGHLSWSDEFPLNHFFNIVSEFVGEKGQACASEIYRKRFGNSSVFTMSFNQFRELFTHLRERRFIFSVKSILDKRLYHYVITLDHQEDLLASKMDVLREKMLSDDPSFDDSISDQDLYDAVYKKVKCSVPIEETLFPEEEIPEGQEEEEEEEEE